MTEYSKKGKKEIVGVASAAIELRGKRRSCSSSTLDFDFNPDFSYEEA
jgi:hypothetical protein